MEEDLRNYRLQLQQVEAALTTDADNEELHKLKGDLQEVIELTQDLLKNQQDESAKRPNGTVPVEEPPPVVDPEQDATARALKRRKWKAGDRCMAKWEEDGVFYEATIQDIIDCTARVLFSDYHQYATSHVDNLKELPTGIKRSADDSGDDGTNKYKLHSRDYLKKKKQKKQQRFKQIEEERESEKNKWLSFNAKSTKKTGSVKGKSIFASPDNVNGRVGIGTCGISGKPMTEFSHGEMWRKGA